LGQAAAKNGQKNRTGKAIGLILRILFLTLPIASHKLKQSAERNYNGLSQYLADACALSIDTTGM
jgi:hypothetical protein